MHDRRSRSELEGLQLLGDLADDTVVSLGRVLRDEALSEKDELALRRVRDLFDLMTSHDVIVVGTSVGRMLGDERSYLDALRVVEREAKGGSIEDYARNVVATLDTVLATQPEAAHQDLSEQLEKVRAFFVGMGERSLARTDELSRSRQESPWRSMRQLSSSS